MNLLNRLVGLVNGDVEPINGLEIHFISVCKGEARAISPEEKKWHALYLNRNPVEFSNKSTNLGQPESSVINQPPSPDSESDLVSSLRLDVQLLNQKVKSQESSIIYLEELNKSFTDIIDSSKNIVNRDAELTNEISNLKENISQKNNEISQLNRRIGNLNIELSKIGSEKDSLTKYTATITADIDQSIKNGVINAYKELYERERNLSGKIDLYKSNIQMLMEFLVSLAPAKIKCPKCDGNPNWTDRNKIQTGSDYEGPNQRFTCDNCNGSGWLQNPSRIGKDALFSRKHMFLEDD